jgi:hypothetical protein
MQKQPKLYIDYHCEITEFIKEYALDVVNDFQDYPITPGTVYVVGRYQMKQNIDMWRKIIEDRTAHVIFSNPAEGSDTFYGQIAYLGVRDLVDSGQLPVISGADLPPNIINLKYDSFVNAVLRFDENIAASNRVDEIYKKTNKPYKCLFLNGRLRTHRKWMLECMRAANLLESSLYTCLETRNAPRGGTTFMANGEDLMYRVEPIKYLPEQYEYGEYANNIGSHDPEQDGSYAKYRLFNREWGEVYIKPEAYIDTYFSLITETVFNTPYSFCTEKIWKAILMGHPWVCVTNSGFYRDMHDLGFKTFENLIDESFDNIQDPHKRLIRIGQVITDLCRSNLPAFLSAAESVCKYNQQRVHNYRAEVMSALPDRFLDFVRTVSQR